MLRRFWADHRNACLLSLALLVVGVMVNPWLFLAAVLPISWVLLNKKPAQDDQPLTITEESEAISEITEEWEDLNEEEIDKKLSELPLEWRILPNAEDERINEIMEKLKANNIPESILNDLAYSYRWKIKRGVALSPSASEDFINRLRVKPTNIAFTEGFDAQIIGAIKERELPDIWKYADDDERIEMLKQDDIENNIFEILSDSGNTEILVAIAKSPSTPKKILKKLSKLSDNDPFEHYIDVQAAIREKDLPSEWRNLSTEELTTKLVLENVPDKVLRIFVHSPNWEIRKSVALSSNTSEDLLSMLIEKDQDNYIDSVLAQRELPTQWRVRNKEIIEKIRKLEIENKTLEILSKSDDPLIRIAVANNPYISDIVLSSLSLDEDYEVKDAVLFRDLPDEWKAIESSFMMGSKVEEDKKDIDTEVLKVLAKSNSYYLSSRAEKVLSDRGISISSDNDEIEVEEELLEIKIQNLSEEFKEVLCNSIAIAGIEDVIGRDQAEIWTILDKDEPDGYDYESDSHTEFVETATNLLSNELLESLQEGIEIFKEKINENRGYITFWELFLELDQTDDLDEFNQALQNILEEIS